ncbi:MAG: hypothetical protein Ct9H90mP16_07450 [Candidatus Poseidoniales archaeon]|nr:MAG: hypothetical protein Ct9H90mP16_07450 [Candidatus Poseidoniales archaeon]
MVIKLLRRYFGIRDDRDKLPFGYVESEEYSKRVKAVVSIPFMEMQISHQKSTEGNGPTQREVSLRGCSKKSRHDCGCPTNLGAQIIHSRFYQECDAIGFANQGDFGTVVLLSTENGSVVGQVQYPLMHRGDISESVSRVLAEHYAQRKPRRPFLSLHRWGNGWSLG